MARYQVILAYDGTDFWGFQRQPGNVKRRTVQGVVEAALKQLGWSGEKILAAGRTDTGVHASGQVVAFDLDWQHDEDALLAALNAHLPQDVAVWAVQRAADDFHPRYAARSRCYEYRLFCQPRRHPLLERYAWQRFEPHPEWVKPSGDARHIGAPFAAGIPGQVRLIYLYDPVLP